MNHKCNLCKATVPADKEFFIIGIGTNGRGNLVCEACFKKRKAFQESLDANER